MLKKDLIVNLTLTAVRVVGLLWMIRLGGAVMVPAAFGMFLLARRVGNTGGCFFQMGVSQYILRFLSMNQENAAEKSRVIWLCLFYIVLVFTLVLPVILILDEPLGKVFFGELTNQGSLSIWTGALMLVSVVHYVAYSALIAERKMVLGNLVEFVNTGGILLVYFLWAGSSSTPLGAIRLQALVMMAVAVIVTVVYLGTLGEGARVLRVTRREEWTERIQTLVRFGPARGLVTFLDMSILMIGPWLLRSSPEQAGFLIVALTLVRIVQAGIMPMTQVASVITARFVGSDDQASIQEGVRLLFGVVLYAGLYAIAVLLPWGHRLLDLWLGSESLATSVWRDFVVVGWGVFPFALFHGLKGVIEMRWFRPLNVWTLLGAVTAHLGLFYLLLPRYGLEAAVRFSLLLAFWILGGITVFWLRHDLRPWSYWGLGRLIWISGLLLMINYQLAQHASIWLGGAFVVVSTLATACLVWFVSPPPFISLLREFFGIDRRTMAKVS